ncbi:MAG: hypothetical protein GY696_05300, partial [Gammaproteobacteria bacterium]|nr:hypothetical protein [Gammaproteobacteria bacterium]
MTIPLYYLRGAKLFQEFCCVSMAKIENQRLKFISHNQKTLRGDKYSRICEDVHAHRNDRGNAVNPGALRAGRQIILPPSFIGSPRYMHAHFQDGMAIVREFHKPDLFITFTCNPKWPEVSDSLLPGQQPSDHPDIVARVFNRKVKQFLTEMNKDSIMG